MLAATSAASLTQYRSLLSTDEQVVGLGLLATGSQLLLWPGVILSSLTVGQLVAYWGDETDSRVDRGAV